jgi:nitrile hydratase
VDGIHDMAGMHGFGPVEPEVDEPVFHERWEGRVVGLMIATAAAGLRAGSVRPGIEAMAAAQYLDASYYERWLFSVERSLVASGALTDAEIDERAAHPKEVHAERPEWARGLRRALQRPNEHPPPRTAARFAVGDRVTVKRMAPPGHTRCPRYVRGVSGVITTVHGGWPLPDASGTGEPETTYTVRFDAADLWGTDSEPGAVYVDLWESYLR